MLSNLFAPIKRVLCPYCLTEIRYRKEINACLNCSEKLPVEYVQKFETAGPFFTQVIGVSKVGKTVYLQALTLVLMQMGRLWRQNFSYAPMTEKTLTYVQNVRQFVNTGQMPPPTQMEIQEAYIMQLNGMERWGGRTIVLRDVAGEFFQNLEFPIKYTPYLMHVPSTLMMLSLSDIRQNYRTSMEDLMQSYIYTMRANDSNFFRQPKNVVIVLSKVDQIKDELPTSLQRYLIEDPIQQAISTRNPITPWDGKATQQYIDGMRIASNDIRDWLSNDPAGQIMIARAKENNINLEFAIVSSTGRSADTSGKVMVELQPYRVLDPFFWALEMQSR